MDATSAAIDALSIDISSASEGTNATEVSSATAETTAAASDGMELVDPIDETAGTETVETPAPSTETDLAEVPADEPTTPEAPAAAEAQPPVPGADADILAEGGRLQKDRRGNEVYVFDKAAAARIVASNKTMKVLMEKTGMEALTPETVEAIAKNHKGLNDLREDLSSGDPQMQASAMAYMLRQTAAQKGQLHPEAWKQKVQETAGAIVAAAQHSHPEVEEALYQTYEPQVTSNIIENLYQEALRLGGAATAEGKRATAVAQFLDQRVNGQFRKSDALDKPLADPMEMKSREIAAREETLRAREEADQRREWETYTQGISQDRNAALDATITESLAPVEKAMAAFPEQMKSVKVRLRTDAIAAVTADPAWKRTFQTLIERARNAASNEIRVQIRTQLKQEFHAKVRAAIQRIAPPIVNEASKVIANGSQQKHERAAAAQKQRPAVTNGAPASPTVAALAPPGSRLSHTDWAKQIDALAVKAS